MEKEKLMAKYGLRDYVYEHLRRKIRKGEIERSEILTINQLCIELDISRTPIREAIAQLENEGFVTILPQRGIKIRELNRKEFLEIYQILGALESSLILTCSHLMGKKEN